MKDFIVKQDDQKDCGICCLLSIIKYYHGDVSKEYLRNLTNTTKDGVTAYNIIEASKVLGFNSLGLKGPIEELKSEILPVIAHTIINNYQHFVVIYEINQLTKKIVIMDPGYGIKKITFDEWKKISTNNYLYFKPNKIIPIIKNNKSILNIYKPFIKSNKVTLIIIILLSSFYVLINIITSYNFKLLMNDLASIKLISIMLITFIFIKKILNYYRTSLMNYLYCFLDKILFNDLFKHLIHLPIIYYKNRTTGDIMTRINDLTNVKELISHLFISLFIDSILVVFVYVILLSISIKISILLLIMMVIYSLVIIFNSNQLNDKIKNIYRSNSEVNSYITESIENVDTIKGIHLEDTIINRFYFKYNDLLKNNLKLLQNVNKENFIKELLYEIMEILILIIGIKELNTIDLVTYIGLVNYFTDPIKGILGLNLLYKNTKESIRRIKEIYEIDSEKIIYDSKMSISNFKGNIKMKNISFSYNGIDNVLTNINLDIKQGEKVLICGKSGNGKSTLMKIIMKYLDKYHGTITIDNYDLKDISLYDIRNRLCYVSQKENVYTDTIYNNIVLFKDIKYENFLDIVKKTGVDEIVKNNPMGYNYRLEENAFNLSGGERQRIIIARTILCDRDIYIFDEAMNAIDINKERTILRNIFSMLHDKTIIVISHRFSNNDLFNKTINIGRDNYEFI